MLLGSRTAFYQPYKLAVQARRCCAGSRTSLQAVAAVKSTQPPPTVNMAAPGEAVSLRGELSGLFKSALTTAYPAVEEQPIVAACNNPQHGDYQCNNSMSLFGKLKGKEGAPKNPREVATAIVKGLPQNNTIQDTSLAGPGFINVKVTQDYLAGRINTLLTQGGWAGVSTKALRSCQQLCVCWGGGRGRKASIPPERGGGGRKCRRRRRGGSRLPGLCNLHKQQQLYGDRGD